MDIFLKAPAITHDKREKEERRKEGEKKEERKRKEGIKEGKKEERKCNIVRKGTILHLFSNSIAQVEN